MPDTDQIKPTNLLNIIDLLDKHHRTLFRKYLQSPFFHQQPQLIKLADLIFQFLPNFSRKKDLELAVFDAQGKIEGFAVSRLFTRIYPEETDLKSGAQQKTKIYNLCSDLFRAVEDYIAFSQHKKDPLSRHQYNAEFALTQNNYRHWELSMKRYKKAIDEQGDSLDTRYDLYRYHKMRFESPFNDRLDKKNAEEQLHKVFHALDIFHWMMRLGQICEYVYRTDITDAASTIAVSEEDQAEILKQTHTLADHRYPLLHLYRSLILLKSELGDSAKLRRTFELLISYHRSGTISLPDQNECIRYLLNYCTYRNNLGANHFLRLRDEIESWGLDNGLFMVNGVLPDTIFLNAGLTAAGLKDFEKVKRLIDRYSNQLAPAVRPAAIALIRAYRYFFQENFPEAARELAQVTSKGYFYSIQRHLLAVRVGYYQMLARRLDMLEMINIIQAARQFFRRNNYPVPASRRKSYLDLLLVLQRIVDYHEIPQKNNKRQLAKIKQLLTTRQPALRNWLLTVVADL